MKNLLPTLLISGLTLCSAAEEVLFSDDFTRGEFSLPSDQWEAVPGDYGRGQFSGSGWISKANELYLTLSRFDESAPGATFAQTRLYSKETFAPGPDGTLELTFSANIGHDIHKGIIYTVGFANQPNSEGKRSFVRLEIPTSKTANQFKDQVRFTFATEWAPALGIRDVLKNPEAGSRKSIKREIGEDLQARHTFRLKWAEKKAELYLVEDAGERETYIGGHYIDVIPDGPLHLELTAYGSGPEDEEGFSSELTIANKIADPAEINRSLVMESISVVKR